MPINWKTKLSRVENSISLCESEELSALVHSFLCVQKEFEFVCIFPSILLEIKNFHNVNIDVSFNIS